MNYVIVLGYVAILLGRSRASEDIDIIIPELNKENYKLLYKDLTKSGFYCLNATTMNSSYGYFNEKLVIRFAKKNSVVPNMELKITHDEFGSIALKKR